MIGFGSTWLYLDVRQVFVLDRKLVVTTTTNHGIHFLMPLSFPEDHIHEQTVQVITCQILEVWFAYFCCGVSQHDKSGVA